VLLEGGAFLAILVADPLTGGEIRRTRDILAEQSARIRDLLDTTVARREMLDVTLGWRYRAGYSGPGDQLSSQGLRGAREYEPAPAPGVLRVAAFGDSFVYGNEVGPEESWPARLERMHPTLEVLNFGVGGYGVDQALLRYRQEGAAFRPNIVIMGFTPDDLRRVVNVYRRFISSHEWPMAKPRFRPVPGGRLELVPTPLQSVSDYRRLLDDPGAVRMLGADDQWYEPLIYQNPLYDWSASVRLGTHIWIRFRNRYIGPNRLFVRGVFNPESAAFRIQVLLFESFAREVASHGAAPLVVFLPDRGTLERLSRGQPSTYGPLIEALGARGIPHVDVAPALVRPAASSTIESLFRPGGHYSPVGNGLVARALAPTLLQHRGGEGRGVNPEVPPGGTE
jgi:lysophospholipase L1-like esterase